MELSKTQLVQTIEKEKIIAIVRGIYGDQALALADALVKGGVTLMELTFDPASAERTEQAAAAIQALNERFGNAMCLGAGTVIREDQVSLAVSAGARFIVSPDTNEQVIRASVERGLVSIPGGLTPTEIAAAHRFGADFVKVFPASTVGPAYFKAVKAPLNHVRLLAVGGVDRENVTSYLKAGASGAGIGGCLFTKAEVQAGEWQLIAEHSRALMEIVREVGA